MMFLRAIHRPENLSKGRVLMKWIIAKEKDSPSGK